MLAIRVPFSVATFFLPKYCSRFARRKPRSLSCRRYLRGGAGSLVNGWTILGIALLRLRNFERAYVSLSNTLQSSNLVGTGLVVDGRGSPGQVTLRWASLSFWRAASSCASFHSSKLDSCAGGRGAALPGALFVDIFDLVLLSMDESSLLLEAIGEVKLSRMVHVNGRCSTRRLNWSHCGLCLCHVIRGGGKPRF